MASITICDRCEKRIQTDVVPIDILGTKVKKISYLRQSHTEYIDLCQDCLNNFESWFTRGVEK